MWSALGAWRAHALALHNALQLLLNSLPQTPCRDEKFPDYRATIFTPRGARWITDQLMVPLLRGRPGGMIRSHAKAESASTFPSQAYFAKGVGFVGMAWAVGEKDLPPTTQCFASFRPETEFGTGMQAFEAWRRQWLDKTNGGDPQKWGEYMRRARAIWAFPIIAADRVIAVVSVDSLEHEAFAEGGPAFARRTVREAMEGTIVGLVSEGLRER